MNAYKEMVGSARTVLYHTLLTALVSMMVFGGCIPTDGTFYSDSTEGQVETVSENEDLPDGHESSFDEFANGDPEEELNASEEDEEGARSTPVYHLPFHSGETYKATTYNASYHQNAWDFNLGGGGNADCGEPIVAITSGTVEIARTSDSGSFGKYVRLRHGTDGNKSFYAHLSEVFVAVGQWVERGQALGRIGTTGNSTGCHLHLEVRNGSNVQIRTQFRYFRSNAARVGYLSHNSWYQSRNNGEISSARTRNGGSSTVGSSTTPLASRVDYDGFAEYFNGGSWGAGAIYYQALGCIGLRCSSYNNTNDAWLVRMGFYSYYNSCGGPHYCWLGFPTGDEYGVSGGTRQNFEFGYLRWTPNGGVVAYSY